MARKKSKAEDEQGRVNKMELVRQALATLGNDTSPADIAKHLKDQADVEMSVGMASNYKSSILKKLGLSKRGKRRRARAVNGEAAPIAKASGDFISLKDIRTLHEIGGRLGMSRVREVLDLLH